MSGMVRAGVLFVVASSLPVPLLAGAAAFGGGFSLAALLYLTVLAFGLDQVIGAVESEAEFPAADALCVFLAASQLGLIGVIVWRFGQGVSWVEGVSLFLAAGLFFGQVGNANGHELIHRRSRALHRLGEAVFTAMLFGHHASAHPLVHHRYVATRQDPNSARRGEGLYRFLLRAWPGCFFAGLRAETARLQGGPVWRHPYLRYLGGAGLCLVLAYQLGGAGGLAAYVGLCAYVQSQLLLSDYVQHYGLTRQDVGGRLEPVGDAHSWNAPHVFTSHMMLHAPRHSAHHARPALRYDALKLDAGVPTLPYSLPVMSVIALVPPLYRRIMAQELGRLPQAGPEAAPLAA